MAPQPPTRRADGQFHYHVYDYAGSGSRGPFALSDGVPSRGQFYSLYRDLLSLWEYGSAKKIPGMAFTPLGGSIASVDNDKVRDFRLLMLSLGETKKGTAEILFTGGIHGREWIAAEVAYLLAEYLIKNYPTKGSPANEYAEAIQWLVQSRRIHVIPMLNPAGQHHSVYGGDDISRLWRKNRRALPSSAKDWVGALSVDGQPNRPFRNLEIMPNGVVKYQAPRYNPDKKVPPNSTEDYLTCELKNSVVGVDLNRNFTTRGWGYATRPEQPQPDSLTYFGPRRNSEAEAGILVDFLSRTPALKMAIDYHSFAEAIIYSGEAYNTGGVDGTYQAIGEALESLVRDAEGAPYVLGSPLGAVLGEATGTIPDHIAQWRKVPAFTIELDPPFMTEEKAGFGFPEKDIRKVFEGNIRGALLAIAAAGESPSQITQFASGLGRWPVFGCGNELPA